MDPHPIDMHPIATIVIIWCAIQLGKIIAYLTYPEEIRRAIVRAAPTCTLWRRMPEGRGYYFRPAWAFAGWWVQRRAERHTVIYWQGRPTGMPEWIWSLISGPGIITAAEYRRACGLPIVVRYSDG